MAIKTFTSFKSRRGGLIIENPSFEIIKHKTTKKVISKRRIRYCEGAQSVYLDEQMKLDPTLEASPIVIGKKNLSLDEERDPLKIEFLTKNQHFETQTSTGYKILNVDEDDLYEVKAYELSTKARAIILDGEENLVRSMIIEFISVNTALHTKINKMKTILIQKMEREGGLFAEKVIEFANSKTNNEKLVISLAITEGIIAINDGKTVSWAVSGEAIYVASQAVSAIKDFAVWMKTDEEGRQVLKAISDKLPEKPNNKSKK
tara:strand:+ start:1975 stop:2757 length:783 start_codon:yes stop_codon:yes gene_type:complete